MKNGTGFENIILCLWQQETPPLAAAVFPQDKHEKRRQRQEEKVVLSLEPLHMCPMRNPWTRLTHAGQNMPMDLRVVEFTIT